MNLEKAVMATKMIDADTIVHYQTYDDEHEEFPEHKSTIAEFLDAMTDEGCPEAVDAVPVRHGRWEQVEVIDDDSENGVNSDAAQCNVCGNVESSFYWAKTYYNFCPHCGAKLDGKGNGNE